MTSIASVALAEDISIDSNYSGGSWDGKTFTFPAQDWQGSKNLVDAVNTQNIVFNFIDAANLINESTSNTGAIAYAKSPFLNAKTLTEAKSGTSIQNVKIGKLNTLRWSQNGIEGMFHAAGDNFKDTIKYDATTKGSKSLGLTQNIQIAEINRIERIGAAGRVKSLDAIFMLTNPNRGSDFSQIISGPDGSGAKIGTMVSGAPGEGVGFALITNLSKYEVASSALMSQKFTGEVDSIGTRDNPMRVGILSSFNGMDGEVPSTYSSMSKFAAGSGQDIDTVNNIYASEAGIAIAIGREDSQKVSHVGSIYVNSDAKYSQMAGLYNSSATFRPESSKMTDTKLGQTIGISGKIEVSGSLKEVNLQQAPVLGDTATLIPRENSTTIIGLANKYNTFMAGIANLSGYQTIRSENEKTPVVIEVSSASPTQPTFGLLIIPTLRADKTRRTQTIISTVLEGSFEFKGGDVAMIGQQQYSNNPIANNEKGNATLKLTPSARYGSKLILSEGSNLLVTSKYNHSFTTSKFPYALSEKQYFLEGGTDDLPSIIQFNDPKSYAYIEGTVTGNLAFEFGSNLVENNGTYSLEINKNPVAIKRVQSNTTINLLTNFDEKAKKGSKHNSNDYAHAYLSKDNNLKIAVKEISNNLLIAQSQIANLTYNPQDSLKLVSEGSGPFESVDNEKGSDGKLVNQNLANVTSDGSVVDRTPKGMVVINVAEGLISPKKTYLGDFYLENTDSVGVVPEGLEKIDQDLNKKITLIDSRNIKGTSNAAEEVMTLAELSGTDSLPSDFGKVASGNVTSTTDLVKNPLIESEVGEGESGGGDVPPTKPDIPTIDPNKPSEGGEPTRPNKPQTGENKPTYPNNVYEQSGKTSTMQSLESVGMANYFIWRESLETLTQRMGEVRLSPNLEGLWVRLSGGKNKYSRQGNYFSNKYYGVTLGVDRNIGGDYGWTIGGAFEYIHGDGKLANSGSLKNWLGSLSVYATKKFETAGYLDLVLKGSRMHNDFTAVSDENRYISKGAYHYFGYQLSGEYGKQFFINENWFIEPQAQLLYGRINKVSYKTTTGVKAKVNGINSLIGRVGLEAGYQNQSAQGYIRLDVLRDFTSKYKVNYAVGPVRNHSSVDLKDTWGEISGGGTFNVNKQIKGYAQLKRSFGAKLRQEYRADIGLRIVF